MAAQRATEDRPHLAPILKAWNDRLAAGHEPRHSAWIRMEEAGRPYPDGNDWRWLACDREGHLAIFVISRWGPVPMQALDINYPEDVEGRVIDLPVMSDVNRVASWPDSDVAERGVFLYDWNDEDGAYELVLAPYRPRTLDQLPLDLAEAARSIRFTKLAFSEAWLIDVRSHMTCREASR